MTDTVTTEPLPSIAWGMVALVAVIVAVLTTLISILVVLVALGALWQWGGTQIQRGKPAAQPVSGLQPA